MACYPPLVTGPSSRVELRISCNDLIYADLLSKSDPRVVVHTADQRGAWTEVSFPLSVLCYNKYSYSHKLDQRAVNAPLLLQFVTP